MDKRHSPRRRRGRGLGIALGLILLIALGPSLWNIPRVLVACRAWEKVEETESTSGDEEIRAVVQNIPDYRRDEDKTYLTLPEWYVVYSTDEYAAFVAENSSSDFPYFESVGQYWQSYIDSCKQTVGKYPFAKSGQHFTDMFIGISFTAENMLKGAYEGTIGRVTGWFSDEPTEEEIYAARVAKEYGDFLHNTPWYFFPFKETLSGLWSETSLWGPNPIRKWDRKIMLTIEYGGKFLYSSFTNLGAQATYGGADTSKIYAVTEGVTPDMASADLEIKQQIGENRQLIYITRFEYFSVNAPPLMERGLRFVEIAGNDEILFTVLGSPTADYTFEYGEYLFDLPVLTQPNLTRVAIKVSVADMHLFLQELKSKDDMRFEHFYDY